MVLNVSILICLIILKDDSMLSNSTRSTSSGNSSMSSGFRDGKINIFTRQTRDLQSQLDIGLIDSSISDEDLLAIKLEPNDNACIGSGVELCVSNKNREDRSLTSPNKVLINQSTQLVQIESSFVNNQKCKTFAVQIEHSGVGDEHGLPLSSHFPANVNSALDYNCSDEVGVGSDSLTDSSKISESLTSTHPIAPIVTDVEGLKVTLDASENIVNVIKSNKTSKSKIKKLENLVLSQPLPPHMQLDASLARGATQIQRPKRTAKSSATNLESDTINANNIVDGKVRGRPPGSKNKTKLTTVPIQGLLDDITNTACDGSRKISNNHLSSVVASSSNTNSKYLNSNLL